MKRIINRCNLCFVPYKIFDKERYADWRRNNDAWESVWAEPPHTFPLFSKLARCLLAPMSKIYR